MLRLALLPGAAAWTSFCNHEDWTQVWSDEFLGSALDASSWNVDVRGPGDSKTRDAAATVDNVYLWDGSLVLRSQGHWDGSSWANLSSGAVDSAQKRRWGGRTRVCVSAKLPGGGSTTTGTGIWPAHWLMPDTNVCWPCNGEIDIMEMVNGDSTCHGTYHYCKKQQCGSDTAISGHTQMPGDWHAVYHEYAVEYDGKGYAAFAVDGKVYFNGTSALWFDVPYHVILNTAVGGPWPKAPTQDTVFPTYHFIDYVRVAQPAASLTLV